jgi:cystathionine beta-synthase
MYNDYWMMDQGFIEREHTGDLRDLIARRHVDRATIVIGPDDSLETAYARMKLYELQQLPVMADERIVGIIDESDILLAVYGHEEHFKHPVREAMSARLEVLQPDAPLQALLPIFGEDRVAIVMEGEKFLGLITRYDLLNYLRRRLK